MHEEVISHDEVTEFSFLFFFFFLILSEEEKITNKSKRMDMVLSVSNDEFSTVKLLIFTNCAVKFES